MFHDLRPQNMKEYYNSIIERLIVENNHNSLVEHSKQVVEEHKNDFVNIDELWCTDLYLNSLKIPPWEVSFPTLNLIPRRGTICPPPLKIPFTHSCKNSSLRGCRWVLFWYHGGQWLNEVRFWGQAWVFVWEDWFYCFWYWCMSNNTPTGLFYSYFHSILQCLLQCLLQYLLRHIRTSAP